jgi:predicted neutral ceramidase superfamily lipid hydrolase
VNIPAPPAGCAVGGPDIGSPQSDAASADTGTGQTYRRIPDIAAMARRSCRRQHKKAAFKMDFWHYVMLFLWIALIFMWVMIVFQIITDMFRDHKTSGWIKAIWILLLFAIPFLTALIYLIVNGRKMAERQREALETAKAAQDTYIRQVAQASPADQISQAKQLLDAGAISQEEFDNLKAKALS